MRSLGNQIRTDSAYNVRNEWNKNTQTQRNRKQLDKVHVSKAKQPLTAQGKIEASLKIAFRLLLF